MSTSNDNANPNAIRVSGSGPAALLREFKAMVSLNPIQVAEEAMKAARKQVFRPTARTERHMRTACVSWW